MNKKNKTIAIVAIIFLVLAVVIIGATLGYNALTEKYNKDKQQIADNSSKTELEGQEEPSSQADEPEPEKTLAPDFVVQDYEGNDVKLSDYRGKPVVLNFWASWCDPCKSEMGTFNDAHKQYGDDVAFLMVNLADGQRETVAKAKAFIEENGYEFPVFFDVEQKAAISYSVTSIPSTLFIDKEGYPVNGFSGAIEKSDLETGIKMINK